MRETESLIQIRDLQTHFFTDGGVARAVDGVSYDIPRGKTLALVGESGCGKSVSALSIMRLIAEPPGKIIGGQILFEGKDLVQASPAEMRRIRGNQIGMIFQEPMTSLNPVYTIGDQIVEGIELHRDLQGKAAWDLATEMLHKVGIPAPKQRIHDYPHQLSGGMRQRVMIAMALSCDPELLIADEPTTALDVTIQAQILDLLEQLKADHNMSILMITHDLGVVADMADEVCVMYAGKIVERAGVKDLYGNPQHPYTIGLLGCIPRLSDSKTKLAVIPGNVPNPLQFPSGCRFHPRCSLTREVAAGGGVDTLKVQNGNGPEEILRRCVESHGEKRGGQPDLVEVGPGHWVSCWEVDAARTAKGVG
jgi:oligopeptide/dipeptide ABC transporter ATP-binding protein